MYSMFIAAIVSWLVVTGTYLMLALSGCSPPAKQVLEIKRVLKSKNMEIINSDLPSIPQMCN